MNECTEQVEYFAKFKSREDGVLIFVPMDEDAIFKRLKTLTCVFCGAKSADCDDMLRHFIFDCPDAKRELQD